MTEETGFENLSHEEIVESMLVSARSIVRTCMEIRNHEDVVIITDTHTSEIGRALYEAAAEVTDRVLLLMIPPAFKPGNEPPSPVGDLMRKSRVVLIATRESLTHTKARINASKSGVRIASMPGISKEMFITGGITADYNALQIEISGMNNVFRRRREVHVMTPSGTDVKFTTKSFIDILDLRLDTFAFCVVVCYFDGTQPSQFSANRIASKCSISSQR